MYLGVGNSIVLILFISVIPNQTYKIFPCTCELELISMTVQDNIFYFIVTTICYSYVFLHFNKQP